ncbi:DUF7527 domain-containing protein [Halostagnicola kamekurae]|uniref:DUF7527 domain-containing protein n=1 Tax=Halostagnicola kamekurae TaxID=619731 RepID=A0A1I6S2U7_9EURY|nr:hypothetical protein [Halostagnicola kamekurae]SFS71262.1 hypothetical protein SAMN04488556_2392 [Halostagnicola kamekurae]
MDSRTQERVERWDSRPFTGGYTELSTLADSDFSGAVTADGTWLFMLNGRVVGVIDGEITAFEDASGTIYAAPHASLPLLCSMQAQGGETRANYYTNETPLSEVDQTLKDGSFTGYIELSEQVLSGDYYAVYYGGRRMAAAYIGNAQRLLTGDEAFERAADEVGIYEVVDVEIDVTDVPSGGQSSSSDESTGQTSGSPATGSDRPSDAESSAASVDSAGQGNVSTDEPPSPAQPGSADTRPSVSESDGAEPAAYSGSSPSSENTTRPASASELREMSDLTSPDDEPDPAAASSSPELRDEASSDETDSETVSFTEDAGTAADDAPIDASDSSAERSKPDTDIEETQSLESGPQTTATDDAQSAANPNDASLESDDAPGSKSDHATNAPSVEVAADADSPEPEPPSSEQDAESPASEAEPTASEAESSEPTDEADDAEETGELDARLKQEERWRETRSIPSIDPEKTEYAGGVERERADRAPSEHRDRPEARSQSSDGERTAESRQPRSGADGSKADAGGDEGVGTDRETAAGSGQRPTTPETDAMSAEAALEEYEQRIEALTQHARELESERDQLRAENQELSETVERLRSRIDELEAECERLRDVDAADAVAAGVGESTASQQLSPREALSGTNLFVRYASKSDPTLQTAHDGAGEQGEVAANLQIEQHTTFDSSDVTVLGEPYDEFLADTMEYRFVDWLVQTLLFEIRETGHGDKFGDLYDAIPRIDRAELHASISLEDDETDDVPDEVTFDVVAFDKMGTPLIVANLNDSRDPATEGMLSELEEAASAVTANYPDLGAAMAVTASYFEPGALEVTEQATSSGFLSRSSKLSYVNLSRKQGYHLALVESRSSGFHMTVPEL